MHTKIQPIFIISLPRSGSTLLQKMLMSHGSIASHPEPWFLLPLVYGTSKEGIKTEYGQKQAFKALQNIFKSLPGGRSDYESEVREMTLNIYEKLSYGKPYFLDKTPRYYFILDDLHRIFPEAKFVYLFRSPLSIFASMIEAFQKNTSRRLDQLDRDLYTGPSAMASAFINHRDNAYLVRYESLVTEPEICLKKLCEYLQVEYEESMVENFFNQKLEGHGDALGSREYKSLQNNINKWKRIINSNYRKFRLKMYIQKVDSGYLDVGGYSRIQLLNELEGVKIKVTWLEYYYWFEEKTIVLLKKILRYRSMN